MNYDRWGDMEKRSLRRLSNTCADILREVRQAVAQTADTWQRPVNSTPVNTPAKRSEQKSLKGFPRGGSIFQVLGIALAGFNALAFVGGLSKLLSSEILFGNWLVMAIFTGLCTVGGILLALYGKKRKKACKRYEAYLKLIGKQEAVSIHAISDVLGMDYRDVIKDFKDMILRGILSPAWLDLKTYRLMLTEYTGEIPVEKKEECLSRSERILQQIRADNDLIADEEVSAKIDRIEDLTRKIFAVLDKYPEKEKQLYSFLNYYLPTTLKALESYARLEAQGVETETIRSTKQKINEMLDELCDGYEKQLDKLFENDAVDITADIEVMRKMLERDGLKEDGFPKK